MEVKKKNGGKEEWRKEGMDKRLTYGGNKKGGMKEKMKGGKKECRKE